MKVAVVGATGLVGTRMLEVLAERNFPVTELLPVASAKSVGRKITFQGKEWTVVSAEDAIAARPDLALFSAGGSTSAELAPKFARAVGLVVTIYAMFSVTAVLGANKILAFTSCIISIFYLVVAVVWIIWGFLRDFPLMRRFGLALTLLASGKLFLFDFAGIDDMARTGMFILFGIILLAVSFIYAVFERKLKKQAGEERNNIR